MNDLVIDPYVDKLDFYSNEAINMLRENVQMAGYRCKVLSVTSAVPNEGKSYIAFHLARSLAILGKKTLFLDSDIRNSNIKNKYRITDKTNGLSEYLCGQCPENHLIYKTTIENLDIIFAGKRSPRPSELLSDERFDCLLDSLKKFYDYIIMDTSPVNIVVDATIISKKADTTILVVKSFSTDRSEAIYTKKQLEASGVKILGVVMNLYNVHKTGYGKYNCGKYGYRKYRYRKYRFEHKDKISVNSFLHRKSSKVTRSETKEK